MELLEEFNNLSQGDNLEEYNQRFRELRLWLLSINPYLRESYFIWCYIKGLELNIKSLVQLGRPKELEEAMKLAALHNTSTTQELAQQPNPKPKSSSSTLTETEIPNSTSTAFDVLGEGQTLQESDDQDTIKHQEGIEGVTNSQTGAELLLSEASVVDENQLGAPVLDEAFSDDDELVKQMPPIDSLGDSIEMEAPSPDEDDWQRRWRKNDELLKEMQRMFYGDGTPTSTAPIPDSASLEPAIEARFQIEATVPISVEKPGTKIVKILPEFNTDETEEHRQVEKIVIPTGDIGQEIITGELKKPSRAENEDLDSEVNLNPCQVRIYEDAPKEFSELVVLLIELMEIRLANSRTDSIGRLRTPNVHKVFVERPRRGVQLVTGVVDIDCCSDRHSCEPGGAGFGDELKQNFTTLPFDRGKEISLLCCWDNSKGCCSATCISSGDLCVLDPGIVECLCYLEKSSIGMGKPIHIHRLRKKTLVFDPGGYYRLFVVLIMTWCCSGGANWDSNCILSILLVLLLGWVTDVVHNKT